MRLEPIGSQTLARTPSQASRREPPSCTIDDGPSLRSVAALTSGEWRRSTTVARVANSGDERDKKSNVDAAFWSAATRGESRRRRYLVPAVVALVLVVLAVAIVLVLVRRTAG